MDSATATLAEAVRLGIEIWSHGDRLRFKPKAQMTPALLERIKARKPALMAMLRDAQSNTTDTYDTDNNPAGVRERADTVVSVIESRPQSPRYSDAERRALMGATDAVWAVADRYKRMIPTATVERVITPRDKLTTAIREARRAGDRDRAIELRESWNERAAIMEFDGNLSRKDAERLAANAVLAMPPRGAGEISVTCESVDR